MSLTGVKIGRAISVIQDEPPARSDLSRTTVLGQHPPTVLPDGNNDTIHSLHNPVACEERTALSGPTTTKGAYYSYDTWYRNKKRLMPVAYHYHRIPRIG